MRKTDLKELLETVEHIRREQYPDLDRAFLAAVVVAEDENPEDDSDAIRDIQSALNATLGTQGLP